MGKISEVTVYDLVNTGIWEAWQARVMNVTKLIVAHMFDFVTKLECYYMINHTHLVLSSSKSVMFTLIACTMR